MSTFRKPLEFKCSDESFGYQLFVTNSVETKLGSLTVCVYESPLTTAARLKFIDPHCEVTGTDPSGEQFGVCERFKDQLTWSFKLTNNEKLLLSRLRLDRSCIFCHIYSLNG